MCHRPPRRRPAGPGDRFGDRQEADGPLLERPEAGLWISTGGRFRTTATPYRRNPEIVRRTGQPQNKNGAGLHRRRVTLICSGDDQAAAVLDASVGTEAMVFRMREAIW